MKKIFILLASAFVALQLQAQTSQEEIFADLHLSASNYLAYPTPTDVKLTPAPKGYKPFYISTYARHGSRFLIDPKQYSMPLETLRKAKAAGKLTSMGENTLQIVDSISRMSQGRLGELTPLGARQHRGIAERMYKNFPEVFTDGAEVNARSTIVIRCILSMTAECLQLQSMNPKLRFVNDASEHDMFYMNNQDKQYPKMRNLPGVQKASLETHRKYESTERLMNALFTDPEYVRQYVDDQQLMNNLFDIASNMQSHDTDLDLYPIFTKEECYDLWVRNNYDWYLGFGPSPVSEGKMPFVQSNLLRNFLETADTCITKETPGATLRFGHETCVMPFACLLELGNCAKQYHSPEEVAANWRNYRIFPMASNIQWIFYRKKGSDDILVKILLNEHEMNLPITSDAAPFYHWKDVRNYYWNKVK